MATESGRAAAIELTERRRRDPGHRPRPTRRRLGLTAPSGRWSSSRRHGGSAADDDGVTDPQQIDDAELARARYLRSSGRTLTETAGLIAKVESHNDPAECNNTVAAVADWKVAGTG